MLSNIILSLTKPLEKIALERTVELVQEYREFQRTMYSSVDALLKESFSEKIDRVHNQPYFLKNFIIENFGLENFRLLKVSLTQVFIRLIKFNLL